MWGHRGQSLDQRNQCHLSNWSLSGEWHYRWWRQWNWNQHNQSSRRCCVCICHLQNRYHHQDCPLTGYCQLWIFPQRLDHSRILFQSLHCQCWWISTHRQSQMQWSQYSHMLPAARRPRISNSLIQDHHIHHLWWDRYRRLGHSKYRYPIETHCLSR